MIIDFTAENYRSLKDRQTLSMIAKTMDLTLPNQLISSEVHGLEKISILKQVAIYGANAGSSTF
jgi:AAA15 family ATPase/GTPase